MSYVVCHVKKFKSNDVRGMQIHNQRESENSINKDIDSNRTNLNYDLHNQNQINYNKRVKEILEEGYKGNRAIRKDATVMTGTIVSSDREFFNKLNKEQIKLFFETSYNYFKNFYGERNIIAAQVHLDETTPHMHIMAVPLKEDGRLSAKTMITRETLRRFQSELPKLLQEKGFEIERGIENSKAVHKEVVELKKDTFEDTKVKIEKYNELAKNATERFNSLKDTITLVENIKPKKRLLSSNLSISEDDYKTLKTKAEISELYAIENKDIKEENLKLKYKNSELKKENKILKEKNFNLEKEKQNLNLKLNELNYLYNLSKSYLSQINKTNDYEKYIDNYKVGSVVEFEGSYGVITGYKNNRVIVNELLSHKRDVTTVKLEDYEELYIDLSKNYILDNSKIKNKVDSIEQNTIKLIESQKKWFKERKLNTDLIVKEGYKQDRSINKGISIDM